MSAPLTEAEQNRLIIENVGLVASIAANYRGRKNIPFEDLESEGMVGLVTAARRYNASLAKFSTYASFRIRGAILDLIERWEDIEAFNAASQEELDRVHEWQIWGILPSEGWVRLPASPEQIMEAYEEVEGKAAALNSAMLSLSSRERRMLQAHFMRVPRVSVEQVARDHSVSYYRASEILYGAVRKLRDIVRKIEGRTLAA